MNMSKDEIVTDYRQAKTKMKQIGILAELNACSLEKIITILKEAGEELPERYQKKEPVPDTEEPAVMLHCFNTKVLMTMCFSEIAKRDKPIPITVNGAPIKRANLIGSFDAVTGEISWYIDLISEGGST